jgi:DNA-binding XRE family transcriptional regulator
MSIRLKALEAKLDARKRNAAYLLVENELRETGDKRTQEDIASEIGVSSKTVWEWKTKDQVFIEYKNALADDFLSEKRAYVYGQLMKLIGGSQPSVKALDLYLRRFGLLTEKSVVETVDTNQVRSEDAIKQQLAELEELLDGDN